MRADIVEDALLSIERSPSEPAFLRQNKIGRKIFLSPRGKVFNQSMAKKLSREENITLLCGRYEGVDQRVLDAHEFEEISIGDYVLSGGELGAAVLCDAIIRLIPGVLGNETSALTDSFQDNLLAPPIYTRPREYKGMKVPEVLFSGNFGEIEKWREEQAYKRTKERRPDLLNN
jgi:tRNA (guanine37-N1)-methyltransferase